MEEGGETTFPAATDGHSAESGLSSCGQRGLAVKPHLGQALLFFSMSLDGNTVRHMGDRPAARAHVPSCRTLPVFTRDALSSRATSGQARHCCCSRFRDQR